MVSDSLGPSYNCHRCERPDRDIPAGCPTCPLTITLTNRERQMPWEWERFVHEDFDDAAGDVAALQRAFMLVTEAIGSLPKGQQFDPSWPPLWVRLARAYHDEAAQLRREREHEAAKKLKATT